MHLNSQTMMIPLQLWLPQSWSHHQSYLGLYQPFPPKVPLPFCALSKQGHCFFTSLSTTSATNDPLVTNHLIRKFIASSSKSIALECPYSSSKGKLLSSPPLFSCPSGKFILSLSLSLSLCVGLSDLYVRISLSKCNIYTLQFYSMISKASWLIWNPKLVADVIALLYKQEKLGEADALISETVYKLEFRELELCTFYCCLIDFHSKHKLEEGVFDSYRRLKQLLSISSSVYLKRQAYESMIGGLCVIDLPREVENMIAEMKALRISLKPSVFELRSIVYAYGRLGWFEDMKRSVLQMESEGFRTDTVCLNMVLSSLGAHSELLEMVSWLQRMKDLSVLFISNL